MTEEVALRWWLFTRDLRLKGAGIQRWIVWHTPRCLVIWAFYRVLAHATSGKWEKEPPNYLGVFTAIDRWEEPNREA